MVEPMNTTEAIQEFLLSRAANGAASTTVRWYAAMLKRFEDAFPTLDVTPHDLRAFIVRIRGELSQATAAGYVTVLHTFWKWVSDEYDCPNPMRGIKRAKQPPAQPRGVAYNDVIRLLEMAGTRDRAIIAFLADTGCRLAGVAGLQVDLLDMSKHCAIVQEKGQKQRRVYFTSFTAQLLRKWLLVRFSQCPYVFTTERGNRPLTAGGLAQMLKRLKRQAGVQGRANAHSFRHAFAREYVSSGGDVVTLARLLGHEDITTTAAYYAVFSDDELADLHGKHSLLRGM
jgi:site-specific recombinase XerD